MRRGRGGGEARMRAARARERGVELGGGQQAGALSEHGREERGTGRVEVLGGAHGGASEQQLQRARAGRQVRGPARSALERTW